MSVIQIREWSPQQAAFLDWIEEGTGSCILEAVAGAGKSTTIVEAATRIKGSSILIVFNAEPAKELQQKLAAKGVDWKKANAGTVHSYGLKAYKYTFKNFQVEENKVRNLVEEMIAIHHDESGDRWQPYADIEPYSSIICALVGHAKKRALGVLGQIEDRREWFDIIDRFDILEDVQLGEEGDGTRRVTVSRLIDVAIDALKRNNAQTEIIDYDDMIYMPLIHKVRFWQSDNVFVDEAQDTNGARRALIRALVKKGGRVIAVGDRHQAIYGFTGADADSLDLIKADFNAIELPLSITYRCPKQVVGFARQWVSHIEAAGTAPEGTVRSVNLAGFLGRGDDLSSRDAVLCRNTKPLVELFFALLRINVPCKVLGKDLGTGLIKLATRWDRVKTLPALIEKLGDYKEREIAKALAKKKESRAQWIDDQVETLIVIINRCREMGGTSVQFVVEWIEDLFSDQARGVLTLSTIHKAKGKEWQRVFWLDRAGTCPSKYARQEWQQEQETNLQYVAATRAMSELVEVIVPKEERFKREDAA